MARKPSEWELQAQSLGQEEVQIHQSQMRMMRQQMTSCLRDVSALREEFREAALLREGDATQAQTLAEEMRRDKQDLRDELMGALQGLQADLVGHGTELLSVTRLIGGMAGKGGRMEEMNQRLSACEAQGSNLAELHQRHTSLEDRLTCELQDFAQGADGRRAEVADLRASHGAHSEELQALKASLPENMLRLIGDATEQHRGKLEAASARLEQLHERVVSCEAQGGELGRAHGTLAEEKEGLRGRHASLQDRLDKLEGRLGDSTAIEVHARELQALKTALEVHSGAVLKHGQLLQDLGVAGQTLQASLDERLAALERSFGERVESHRLALAEAQQYMDHLHGRMTDCERLGGSLEEHTGQLEALRSAHEDHLGILAQHRQDLDAHEAKRAAEHEQLVQRLGSVETTHSEASDQHADSLRQAHTRLEAVQDCLSCFERHKQCLDGLQRSHKALEERKAELETKHVSMAERIEYVEQLLGDSADKHAEELAALRDAHAKQGGELDGLKDLHAKAGTVEERLESLERSLGESAGSHSEELSAVRRDQERLQGRLAACEGHGTALGELRRAHGSLDTRHSSLRERMDTLEGMLSDSSAQQAQGLAAVQARQDESHGRLAACEQVSPSVQELRRCHTELASARQALTSDMGNLTDRIDSIESIVGDSANRNTKEIKALKASHEKQAATLAKHTDVFAAHRAQHAPLPDRISFLEQQIGDSADRHAAAVAELHDKFSQEQAAHEQHHGSVRELMAREMEDRGAHHATLSERLDYLESMVGDTADKHMQELAQVASGHHTLAGELRSREGQHGALVERVAGLEQGLSANTERVTAGLQAAEERVDKFTGRLAAIREAWTWQSPRSPRSP